MFLDYIWASWSGFLTSWTQLSWSWRLVFEISALKLRLNCFRSQFLVFGANFSIVAVLGLSHAVGTFRDQILPTERILCRGPFCLLGNNLDLLEPNLPLVPFGQQFGWGSQFSPWKPI